MDHLPIPEHCRSQQIVVPYLGLVKYDFEGFGGFLGRLKYNKQQLLQMVRDEDSRPQAESILQEWLYFGILHLFSEVTRVPLDLQQFVKEEDEKQVVTSKDLPSYIVTVSKAAKEFTEEHHKRMEAGLDLLTLVLGHIVGCYQVYRHESPPSVLFSIFILAETLAESYESLSGYSVKFVARYMSPPPGLYFEKIMKQNGWCLADIQGILFGNTSVGYFSSLLPSYNDREHADCSPDRCNHVTRIGKPLVSLHNTPICPGNCQMIEIPLSGLTEILEQGHYPAIQCFESEQDITVKVVKAESYTAISHVWAHGLGNPDQNAMPACQIRRLLSLIKSINPAQSNPVFWIDTLCVPLDDHYRKVAISRFQDTYREATKVLVLDRSLAQVGCNNRSEQIAHLLCSEWMSRLWTLQEGLLAKSLLVQFKDKIVPLNDLLGNDAVEADVPRTDIVEKKLRSQLASRFLLRDQFGAVLDGKDFSRRPDAPFLALMQNLQRRRTTKPKDEPICLATLLDIDLKQFPKMPSMEDIYTAKGELPVNLIFAPSPRLKTPGFRWAPSTFLEQPITGARVKFLSSFGFATPDGFDFQVNCLRFKGDLTLERSIHLYEIEPSSGEAQLCFLPDYTDYPNFDGRHVGSPAILSGMDQPMGSDPAVLINITREGRIMYGHYELPGFLIKRNRRDLRVPDEHIKSLQVDSPAFWGNWIVD